MIKSNKAPIEDFLPRITASLKGVDTETAKDYVIDAIIEFARKTQILTEVVCIPLESCITSYIIPQKTKDLRAVAIQSVRFFSKYGDYSQPNIAYYIEADTLYLGDIYHSHVCDRVEIERVFVPYRNSTHVPAELYEDWLVPITHLALSHLYLLTGHDWYNANLSAHHMNLYTKALADVRLSKHIKHRALNIKLRQK